MRQIQTGLRMSNMGTKYSRYEKIETIWNGFLIKMLKGGIIPEEEAGKLPGINGSRVKLEL